MKLVAASDFRNTANLEIEDALHPAHVHKGARFTIGAELPVEKLNAGDKRLLAELNAAGRVVEASNTKAVEQIDAEVKTEEARLKKLAKAEKAAAKAPAASAGEEAD